MTVYERVKAAVTPVGTTVKALAKQLGTSPSTTYEALELLRAEGEIERQAMKGTGGRPAWRYWKAYW